MLEILYSIVVFSGTLMAIAAVILWVIARMVPRGDVHILVNEERDVASPTGQKLLGALAGAGIFVPSACGGGGTCGQCKVKVLKGGGELLPTEASLITKREAREGERLACQVSVFQDLEVSSRSWFSICRRAKRWISKRAATCSSSARRTNSATPTSTSTKSTGRTGNATGCSNWNHMSPIRPRAPTRWRAIPRKGTSSS
jgi:Na+-transporting NADH:ubiquinone oxidoreductase subunit NqrF